MIHLQSMLDRSELRSFHEHWMRSKAATSSETILVFDWLIVLLGVSL
jgi:hypothetical protein